jgi:hypothetical protein
MTDNDNDPLTRYQLQSKMFYHIVITGLSAHAVVNNIHLSEFARRMGRAHRTLCKMTGSWHEDERYKGDPRWRNL